MNKNVFNIQASLFIRINKIIINEINTFSSPEKLLEI